MVSEEQRREMLRKMSLIIQSMKTSKSISEISEITGIPTSTVQRYLNRPDYFSELANEGIIKRENVPKAIEFTKQWLESSKKTGLKKGGQTSQERHGYQKTKDGRFSGNNYDR